MKKIILQYAAYNVWANQQLVDAIGKIPESQALEPVNSSFSSIYATLAHLWDAESIWWQRLKLTEQVEVPGNSFTGNASVLGQQVLKQSSQWKEWVEQATEAALEHEFIYRDSKKEQHKQPVAEALMHLFNHQSYHRGQLITLLRQAGVSTIPNTDFIAFLRKK